MNRRTLTRGAIAAAVAAALATTGTVMVQAEEGSDSELSKTIDTILEDKSLSGSQIGVVVADAKSGETIYNHNGGMRTIPASNNKIETSAAAMEVLGGDYTFTTDVAAESKPSGGTIAGDLYLRGTGDPTMMQKDYEALAKSLADKGVTTVDGNLVADDTAFGPQRLGTEWGWDDLPYYYAAEVTALTVAPNTDYDAGSINVSVTPGAEGEKAKVKVTPPNDYVKINNTATTGASGEDSTVSFSRDNGVNTIDVSGTIPADSEGDMSLMTVTNPTGLAADVFAKALADNGISVSGDVQLGKATPDGSASLVKHDSMPIAEMMTPFMKLSNNPHAEALTKAIGIEASGEGTFDAGVTAIQEQMAKLGVATDQVRQVDGSGMSRQNAISPKNLASLLVDVRDAGWFKTWYGSMPIACKEDPMVGGTLASRMCDTPAAGNVHAKTGSMTGVSAMSGYVKDQDGRDLVFSVVTNDFVADSVKEIEDKVAVALASTGGSDSVSPESLKVPQPKKDVPEGLECSWVKPIAC